MGSAVVCGEVNQNLLQVFEGVVSGIFQPLLVSQTMEQWGQLSGALPSRTEC